jgi:hypothetical protein
MQKVLLPHDTPVRPPSPESMVDRVHDGVALVELKVMVLVFEVAAA